MSSTLTILPARGSHRPVRTHVSRRSTDSFWRPVLVWSERRHQRLSLQAITEVKHLLDDVGITRAQALHEAGKPFWRP
jgi:uncharacterized protein YjiS (DUF1127 family)